MQYMQYMTLGQVYKKRTPGMETWGQSLCSVFCVWRLLVQTLPISPDRWRHG